MKKLLTFAFMLGMGLCANAQDTSGWKEGDDVTTLLNWKATYSGDEDITNPAWQGFDYPSSDSRWEFNGVGGNSCAGAWGVYNIPQWDVYQEFTVPAGFYTVKVQGCYREGDAGVSFQNWCNGTPTQNAYLYVNVGDKHYETKIMSLWGSKQQEQLFEASDWQNDQHRQNAKDGEWYWAPSCHNGFVAYAENGNYAQNEVFFVVAEEMTIRVGINKPTEQAQDQVWWDNWKMIYEGEYDPVRADRIVAYFNFNNLKNDAEKIKDGIMDNFTSLGSLMQDDLMEIEPDPDNLDEINAAIQQVNDLVAKYQVANVKVGSMAYVLTTCEGLAEATDFPAKAELQAAITQAQNALLAGSDNDHPVFESVDDYLKAASDLANARVNYVMSKGKDADGSIDMTYAISCPWFVNQEYTPTFRDGEYKYPQEIEEVWNSGHKDDEWNVEVGTNAYKDDETQFLPAIADKVRYTTSKDAENRWIFINNFNGWIGGMKPEIQWIKGYTAIHTGWSAGPNTGDLLVQQVVTNLPDGYYTLQGRAFGCANEGNWDDTDQYVFMNYGDKMARSERNPRSIGYWDGWGRDMWSVLDIPFTFVQGGTVTIGYRSNSWSAVTGVVLKYFGEEIDFTSVLSQKIDELKNDAASKIFWKGDVTAFNDILAKIVLPVEGLDAYTEATSVISEAKAFLNAAAAGESAYDVPNKYLTLQGNYAETSEQYAILDPAITYAFAVGENDEDTYKMAGEVANVYAAYESYLRTYDKAASFNTDKLNALLAEQATALKAAYASAYTLGEYEKALLTPINEAIFAERGAANATETNPMNITDLLVNPSFAEGPTAGWTCEGATPSVNTYGRQNAEIWNASPFDLYQVVKCLPEGTYELRARALYRDAGDVGNATSGPYYNWFYAANQDINAWENHNAVLYMSDGQIERNNYIKSVCDGQWTTPSFDEWWNMKDASEEYKALGYMVDWDGTVAIYADEYFIDEDVKLTGFVEFNAESPSYPYDTRVQDGENVYYYPSSMGGFKFRCDSDPTAYCNSVQIHVEEGGNLKLGIRKDAAIGSDWVIFDDFELFYLGKAIPNNINSIDAKSEKQVIYNLAGQRLTAPQKGINIINGKKVLIK